MGTLVKNVYRNSSGVWYWELLNELEVSDGIHDITGEYCTNRDGDGIFKINGDRSRTQKIGTSQFSACQTVSGMRRKLNKIYNEI